MARQPSPRGRLCAGARPLMASTLTPVVVVTDARVELAVMLAAARCLSAHFPYTADLRRLSRGGKRCGILLFFCFLLVSAETAKAGQTLCPLSPDFSLLKASDASIYECPLSVQSWSFLYKGRSIYQISGAEVRDIFGGNDTGNGILADCSDIMVNRDNFAVVMGRERDLLIAGGVISGPQGAKAVNFLHYYPHDGRMILRREGDNILLTWGRQSDLTTRLCWSPNNDGHWWHSDNHRTGGQFGGCVSSQWIWHQGGQSGV